MYAVWVPALPTDSRSEWSRLVLDDPRVRHLWDQEHAVADALAERIGHDAPVAYDIFAVYRSGARWNDAPVESGWTVIGESNQLRTALVPMLSPRS